MTAETATKFVRHPKTIVTLAENFDANVIEMWNLHDRNYSGGEDELRNLIFELLLKHREVDAEPYTMGQLCNQLRRVRGISSDIFVEAIVMLHAHNGNIILTPEESVLSCDPPEPLKSPSFPIDAVGLYNVIIDNFDGASIIKTSQNEQAFIDKVELFTQKEKRLLEMIIDFAGIGNSIFIKDFSKNLVHICNDESYRDLMDFDVNSDNVIKYIAVAVNFGFLDITITRSAPRAMLFGDVEFERAG